MNQDQIEKAARALYGVNPYAEEKIGLTYTWGDMDEDIKDEYREQARAVIAAIHPTVSTVEELDALPEGSVIRFIDITPTVAVKDDEATWCGSHGLNYYGWDDDDPSPVPFPATVLYTPGGAE